MERRSDCGLLIRWNRGLSLPFTQTKHYRLNILDFPHYKVIGDRVVPSDGRTNPCWFADLRYTYAAPLPHKYYESIAEVVLPSPIVGHAIATTSAICGQSFSKVSKRAKCLLDEIKAKFSRFICKICGYLLFKIFRRLMNSIFVSPHQMQRLQAAAQTSTPILYLPLHRSHLDYLLITFTLWHWGLQLPHIASGSNLNLSGFGWLLRATGAFFIRRRIDGDGRPPNLDLLYRSVLEAYMIEILRARMPLEFFLEGTRSRFGKPLPPKNGLLSNVVKAVLQGTLKDVWIVPVSFTYDSVVEGIFENELMGVSRQKESVWKVMRHVISDFKRGKCGCVYIDFGQPTLLSEQIMKLNDILDDSRGYLAVDVGEGYRKLLPWQYGKRKAVLIQAIGYSVIHDAQISAPVSIASIASSVVLSRCMHFGNTIHSIYKTSGYIAADLTKRGFEITEEVDQRSIMKALSFIGPAVKQNGNKLYIKQCHTSYLHLAYYKNSLVPCYAIPSVIALVFLSSPKMIELSKESLIDCSLMLCDLLVYEVIFCKPLDDLRDKIKAEVDLLFPHITSPKCIQSLHSLPLSSGENNAYFDMSDTNGCEKFKDEFETEMLYFYASILRPFLQSMYLVLQELVSSAEPETITPALFIHRLLSRNPSAYNTSFKLLDEAVNADSFMNAIKLLRFKEYLISNFDMIGLKSRENSKNLLLFIEQILFDSEPKNISFQLK